MLAENRNYLTLAPITVIAPGAAIFLIVLGLSLFGDGRALKILVSQHALTARNGIRHLQFCFRLREQALGFKEIAAGDGREWLTLFDVLTRQDMDLNDRSGERRGRNDPGIH